MTKLRHKALLLFLGLAGQAWDAGANEAVTVDVEDLWLPKSYIRHLPRLYDAAQLMANNTRCARFIEGQAHLDKSSLEHPVFILTCENPEGRTYSLVVDGPSLEVLDSTRPSGRVSFEQLEKEYQRELALERERERKRQELAEREREASELVELRRQWEAWWQAEQKRRVGLWEDCVAQLQERVGAMRELEWLTQTMPEPSMPQLDISSPTDLGEPPPVNFQIDFNAVSYAGEDLRYRAFCRSEAGGALELEIKPRR